VTSPDGDWVVVVVAGEGEFTCVAGGIATVARESSCASEPANASRDNEASRASGDVVPCSGEASSCVVDAHGATGVVGHVTGNAGPGEPGERAACTGLPSGGTCWCKGDVGASEAILVWPEPEAEEPSGG
jgi:hypothetical protein